MRILIVSDTHRRSNNFYTALQRVTPVDLVIHCGDAEGYEDDLEAIAGCPLQIVQGNCDFFSRLPRELDFRFAGYRFWVTHGHNYYVNSGTDTIKDVAVSRGMDIVCFGHTHRPVIEKDSDRGIIALNPGSLTQPRQEGRRPSYIVMDVEGSKEPIIEIQYL